MVWTTEGPECLAKVGRGGHPASRAPERRIRLLWLQPIDGDFPDPSASGASFWQDLSKVLLGRAAAWPWKDRRVRRSESGSDSGHKE